MVTKITKVNKPKFFAIKVSEKNKQMLDDIKLHPRETYDEVLSRLLIRVK